jgi:hypothetical protein
MFEVIIDHATEVEIGPKRDQGPGRKYGEDLVCVRCRYDETSRTRLKTVGVIVEKKQLTPMQSTSDNAIVPVQIAKRTG